MLAQNSSSTSSTSRRFRKWIILGPLILIAAVFVGLYAHGGMYSINVVLRRGMTIWIPISNDDPRISNAMRLALREHVPQAVAGKMEWRSVANGFEEGSG